MPLIPQVYVYAIVGRDFYKQFRVWIISFTKVVFAMHPPGEHLHLASLANATVGAAVPAWRLLLTLANGMRLPYMILTGLGWGTFAFNIPLQVTGKHVLVYVHSPHPCTDHNPLHGPCCAAAVGGTVAMPAHRSASFPHAPALADRQLALVGRAIKDNEAQCSTAFFSSPQASCCFSGLEWRVQGAWSGRKICSTAISCHPAAHRLLC